MLAGLTSEAPAAASRPSNYAAPALVQLGVMGADVVPYIPQSKESLTAQLRPESTKKDDQHRRTNTMGKV